MLVLAAGAHAQDGLCLPGVDPAACQPTPAEPPNEMRIDEVMLAHGGRAAQFVELRDSADEQFPDEHAPYRVVVYDFEGNRVGTHTIDPELLQGRDNRQALLLATEAASTTLNVAADEPLRVPLPPRGEACFTYGAGETRVSCVAWGCVANPVGGAGPYQPPPDSRSLQRQGRGSVWQVSRPTARTTNRVGTTGEACPSPPREAEPDQPDAPQGPSPQFVPPPPEGVADVELDLTRRLAVKGRRVAFRAECLAGGLDCDGRAVLRRRGKGRPRLGVASFSIPAGTTKKVRIKLSKRTMRALRRKGRLKAKVVVTVTGVEPFKRAVTLRR